MLVFGPPRFENGSHPSSKNTKVAGFFLKRKPLNKIFIFFVCCTFVEDDETLPSPCIFESPLQGVPGFGVKFIHFDAPKNI